MTETCCLKNVVIFIQTILISILLLLTGCCKDLQLRKMIHNVFWLKSIVPIKQTEQTLPLKIYHKKDIPYSQSDKISWVIEEYLLFILGVDQRPLQNVVGSHFVTAIDYYLRPLLLSQWGCFQGSTDPPLYAIVQTVFVKI